MISLIAAVGKNYELGKNNKLIWNIKEDMKFFKETTIGHTVIVGHNTFMSFPNGLTNRKMIVISNSISSDIEKSIFVTTDIDEIIKKYSSNEEEVFVIGGASIYKQFVDYADKIYLTEIEAECIDADTFFPIFKLEDYSKDVLKTGVDNEIEYRMCLYKKKGL